ncbi:cation diffusion facilitator family transporter [Marinimicrobium koreense]|uniref:Cation diffusion facilitator family transporter n=1 Tax=Marinimicrobium koreense TaxID=306545 RepID=A0A3N1P8R5_9GAMM|nr:cation diffusion facilitator family transporter [Marinimicrobium koreense]ROQ21116.1 cation diffusion facilitator family transporter [Marinimicrobium koreense]
MGKWHAHHILWLSLAAALATMGLKSLAWQLTGSVGYLSDALESVVNLLGAGFALTMFQYARRPPDDGHPFGHGKAEYFAAAFEGGMIFLAALAILVAAGERLLNPETLQALNLGTGLSVGAALINLAVARLLLRYGRALRSPALEGDGRHLMTDVWTTVGVVLGVGLAKWTGLLWLDPVVAIAVALHILHEGWQLLAKSANGLMDRALSPGTLTKLEQALQTMTPESCGFHRLRTRASGAQQFAEVDLQVPGDWTVRRAHDLADAAEHRLAELGVVATVHIEPVGSHGTDARQH